MKPNIAIALGAGLISAVVFASAAAGDETARLPLLAVAGLPIALAGFSYNANTAIVAAAIASAFVLLIAAPLAAVVFAVALAFPPAILIRWTLFNRDLGPGQTEWYPIGRVLLAAALMAGSLVGTAFLLAATDIDKLRASVRSAVVTMVKKGFAGIPGQPMDEANVTRLSEYMLNLLPGVSAIMWMGCTLLCLWIAGRVALASGQLARPWPDLAAFSLPVGTPLLLAAALAASLALDAVPRLVALSFAGALYALYVLLGLAIIHYNTRGLSWRGPALTATYFSPILPIPFVPDGGAVLFIALLGLADSFRPMRRLPGGPKSPDPV